MIIIKRIGGGGRGRLVQLFIMLRGYQLLLYRFSRDCRRTAVRNAAAIFPVHVSATPAPR
jgi:hypothetical protein